MERAALSDKFPIGSVLPEFELTNVDGSKIGSKYLRGGKLALVVFTCNHCPYVKGSEEMLIKVVKDFQKDGLKTVTISSNDALQYPEDDFENMKNKARDMKLPYPYLYDESQAVARMFDAACTPECYLFDSKQKLIFHGAVNDNPKDRTKVTKSFIATAIQQGLEGTPLNPSFVHPIGCSIKWKQK